MTRFLSQTCGAAALLAVSTCAPALAAPLPATLILRATLNGQAQVPGPGDPHATGSFIGTLATKKNELCYELEVRAIGLATGANIHVATPQQADIVVLPLNTPDANGRANACVTLGSKLGRHIAFMPDEYYVNIVSPGFPRGAVRGQLAKEIPGTASAVPVIAPAARPAAAPAYSPAPRPVAAPAYAPAPAYGPAPVSRRTTRPAPAPPPPPAAEPRPARARPAAPPPPASGGAVFTGQ